MGSCSELLDRLDFDRGLIFQDEVRRHFRSPVHHPFPTLDGSFFLLATFRRFLFRLTEESVAIALQSCLGGRAEDFHVKFLSNNHFRFSVFSKDVGFYVYKLRRVISTSFDVYFHLWNNGTPHWEKEKRAWEIEQEKEWTEVLSKSAKKEAKRKEKQKCVRFAKPIVQSPPITKHEPKISVSFGPFCTSIDPSKSPGKLIFGSLSASHRDSEDGNKSPKNTPKQMVGSPDFSPSVSNLNLNRLTKCSRCLDLGHTRRQCRSRVRCIRCFKLGHMKIHCRRHFPRPIWEWRPKAISTKTTPSLQWRPKIPVRAATQPGQKQTESEISLFRNDRLESRTPVVADSTVSSSQQQEQNNFQSSTSSPPSESP
jgi:hypothetical protein